MFESMSQLSIGSSSSSSRSDHSASLQVRELSISSGLGNVRMREAEMSLGGMRVREAEMSISSSSSSSSRGRSNMDRVLIPREQGASYAGRNGCSCGPQYKVCSSRLDSKAKQFIENSYARELDIEEVPGIGAAIGDELRQEGVETAGDLFEELEERGKRCFMQYIGECGGNASHQRKAYQALHDWNEKHGRY